MYSDSVSRKRRSRLVTSALEGGPVGVLAPLVAVADDDLLLLGRVEEVLDGLRRQVADGRLEVPAVLAEDRPRGSSSARRPRSASGPTGTRAPPATLLARSGMTRSGSMTSWRPDAGAGGAGAVGRVEREAARLELVDRRAVVRAAVALAVAALLEVGRLAVPRRRRDDHDALAQAERGLDRSRPAGRRPGGGLARAPPGARTTKRSTTTSIVWRLYLSRVGVSARSSCSPSTRTRTKPCLRAASKTRSPSVLRSLTSGPEDEQPGPLRQAVDLVDDLLDGLALDLAAAGRAVRVADPGEEQPQVVVDLGDRADGRARVPAGALLVDGDGRREPVDLVDVRLLHLAQELAGVRREALDVAALALGVDRVEGEAALARAGQAGDHDQPVARASRP